jgi:alginate O-acetyltransferase complex protein AlgI
VYLNLWICFLASGLWHGAAWTFVAWGAYQGFFLTLERLGLGRGLARLPRPAGVLLTFLAVTVGWVLFRAPDLPAAGHYLLALAQPGSTGRFHLVTLDQWCALAVGLLVALVPAPVALRRRVQTGGESAPPLPRMAVALPLLLLTAGKVMTVTYNPFLYFRF